MALGHDVPIVLVTGDDVTAAEARALCSGVETAVVKTAVTAIAEMATWIAGVEQVDRTAVRMAADDPIRLFRTFITSVVLTREIAE